MPGGGRASGNRCPIPGRLGSWSRDTGTCDRVVSAGTTNSTWTGEVAGSRGATGKLGLCSRSLPGRCGSSRYVGGRSMAFLLKADMGQRGDGSSGHEDQGKRRQLRASRGAVGQQWRLTTCGLQAGAGGATRHNLELVLISRGTLELSVQVGTLQRGRGVR